MSIGALFRGLRSMSQRGFTLEASMLVMMLISVLVIIAFAGAVTTVRTANLDYRNARVSYASEAAAEDIMAQIHKAMADGLLTDQDLASITQPSVPGFKIEGFSVKKMGTPVKETITEGSFAGLFALAERAEIIASAADAIGNRSTAAVGIKAQSIPLFQFAVFFETDLDIAPGQKTTFDGWVHSNGRIYASAEGNTAPTLDGNNKGLGYFEQVTTPKQYINDEKAYPDVKWNTYLKNNAGAWVRLTFDSKTKPNPADFKAASNSAFDGRLRTDAFEVPALRVPLPLGVEPIELLQPRDGNDGDLEKANKFAWRADWHIRIPVDMVSPGVPAGTKVLCPKPWFSTRSPGKVEPTQADCEKIFSWTLDAFFDARELRYVDVFEIDIDKLSDWGKKDLATQNTQLLYVTFTGTPAADPKGDGFFPVVRVVNGNKIKSEVGLTIATDRPFYVQGDYNSDSKWVPAAIVADANTVLSNAWTDANAVCDPYVKGKTTLNATCPPGGLQKFKLHTPTPTTVYAAILAGHQATPCYYADPGCPGASGDGSYWKGGGTNDLLTQLEAWNTGNVLLRYRGSLVSLHEGANGIGRGLYAKGKWAQAYYTAPNRDYAFDARFNDPANLPPGTPAVGQVIQTSFRPIY